jgi:hypothetical protein
MPFRTSLRPSAIFRPAPTETREVFCLPSQRAGGLTMPAFGVGIRGRSPFSASNCSLSVLEV